MNALGWHVAVNNGQTFTVFVNGLINKAKVFIGGILNIFSGGAATDTTVNSGGTESVYGIDKATTVNDGGYQYILSGGVAIGTVLNDPGTQIVSSGGTANGAILNGGEQDVYGAAISTIINSDGFQNIQNGGTASGTTINSGGTAYVSSGGTATDVSFGGTSGALDLETASGLSGTISGWQPGDIIDFVHASIMGATIRGSTLIVTISGGQAFNYQLAGQQAGTSVSLQSDGSGGTDVQAGLRRSHRQQRADARNILGASQQRYYRAARRRIGNRFWRHRNQDGGQRRNG